MKVYHFVNAHYGLENIERRRLKIATIHDLNDPFELLGVNLADCELRRAFLTVKDQLAQGRGMLCFSQRWSNPVQWSHYADRHRGLCLGFEIADKHVTPVTYSNRRLALAAESLIDPRNMDEKIALKFLTTKFAHWRYEAEVRCFLTLEDLDSERKLYFKDFSDDLRLAEVIVGATSDVSRNQISDALGDLTKQVKAFKARLAFNTFSVVRQRNEALWQ